MTGSVFLVEIKLRDGLGTRNTEVGYFPTFELAEASSNALMAGEGEKIFGRSYVSSKAISLGMFNTVNEFLSEV